MPFIYLDELPVKERIELVQRLEHAIEKMRTPEQSDLDKQIEEAREKIRIPVTVVH